MAQVTELPSSWMDWYVSCRVSYYSWDCVLSFNNENYAVVDEKQKQNIVELIWPRIKPLHGLNALQQGLWVKKIERELCLEINTWTLNKFGSSITTYIKTNSSWVKE